MPNAAVVLQADSNYLVPLRVTLQSISKAIPSSVDFDVVIFRQGWPMGFSQLLEQRFPNLNFLFFESALKDLDNWGKSLPPNLHISEVAFQKVFVPKVLMADYERILILDCDLILRADPTELLRMDLKGKVLGAVRDMGMPCVGSTPPGGIDIDIGLPPEFPYYNTGVLLVDAGRWEKYSVTERAVSFLRIQEVARFAEQDALNHATNGHVLPLPLEWNTQSALILKRSSPLFGVESVASINRAKDYPKIIHFAGGRKPWNSKEENPLFAEWRELEEESRFSVGPADPGECNGIRPRSGSGEVLPHTRRSVPGARGMIKRGLSRILRRALRAIENL